MTGTPTSVEWIHTSKGSAGDVSRSYASNRPDLPKIRSHNTVGLAHDQGKEKVIWCAQILFDENNVEFPFYERNKNNNSVLH